MVIVVSEEHGAPTTGAATIIERPSGRYDYRIIYVWCLNILIFFSHLLLD